MDILAAVTGGENSLINVDKIIEYTQTVQSEESQLKSLKDVLGTQVSNQPVKEICLFCFVLGDIKTNL